MKAIAENIYTRGQHGIQYVRRRIPAAIRAAYPACPHPQWLSFRSAPTP